MSSLALSWHQTSYDGGKHETRADLLVMDRLLYRRLPSARPLLIAILRDGMVSKGVLHHSVALPAETLIFLAKALCLWLTGTA